MGCSKRKTLMLYEISRWPEVFWKEFPGKLDFWKSG
jgi:hypothetical protein